MENQLDLYKTICACYSNGKRVGSVPATAPNASAYLSEMATLYGGLEVKYEQDTTGGLLAAMHGRRC